MPRVSNFRAIATKASIASLFAMVEVDGEIEIHVASEHAAYTIRNRCYAYRSKLRKSNLATTGLEASTYDGVEFSYGPVPGHPEEKWWFKLTYEAVVEFELIVPEHHIGDLPHFDTLAEDSDVPQLTGISHEEAFHHSADEFMNTRMTASDEEIPF